MNSHYISIYKQTKPVPPSVQTSVSNWIKQELQITGLYESSVKMSELDDRKECRAYEFVYSYQAAWFNTVWGPKLGLEEIKNGFNADCL